MLPALAMGRPCGNLLLAVSSNLKVSKFQARTGARHPLGIGTQWEGTQATQTSLGLWAC